MGHKASRERMVTSVASAPQGRDIPKDPFIQDRMCEDLVFRGVTIPGVEAIPDTAVSLVLPMIDSDGDLMIRFDTRSNRYGICVQLKDVGNLSWKECQAICDAFQVAERGTKMTNEMLEPLAAKLKAKYGSGRVQFSGGRAFLITNPPDTRCVKGESTITETALAMRRDVCVVQFETAERKYAFAITFMVNNPAETPGISIAECQAMKEVFSVAEPGDFMDNTKFLTIAAAFAQKFNRVEVVTISNVLTCKMEPTTVKRTEPIPQLWVAAAALHQSRNVEVKPAEKRDVANTPGGDLVARLAAAAHLCSFPLTGTTGVVQDSYQCHDCDIMVSRRRAMCSACAEKCHVGHNVTKYSTTATFFCNCGRGDVGPCKARGNSSGGGDDAKSADKEAMAARLRSQVAGGKCTFAVTGKAFQPHEDVFRCETCGLTDGLGCCASCAKACHAGHVLRNTGSHHGFYCDCGAGAKVSSGAVACKCMPPSQESSGGASAYAGVSYAESDLITSSGQATLYKGRHKGQVVAVKVFHKVEDVGEWKAEIIPLLRVTHANVITVVDFFEQPRPCIVMPFVEGGNLMDFVAGKSSRNERLSDADVIHITLGIARGLSCLHHAKYVHRDMKSLNVMMRDGRDPIIIDLGMSKANTKVTDSFMQSSGRRGTPLWMAPEMMRDAKWNAAVDVYALGIIMWELMTCEVPYANQPFPSMWAIMNHVISGKRPALSRCAGRPGGLVALMQQCWDGEPKARPKAKAVVESLESAMHVGPSRQLSFADFVTVVAESWSHVVPEPRMYETFSALKRGDKVDSNRMTTTLTLAASRSLDHALANLPH